MAKQVIILDISVGPGGDTNVHYAFWLVPPAANAVKRPGAVSVYLGANSAEIINIQSGATLEETYSSQYPASFTLAQIEADLQARYNVRQTSISAALNPVQWYGTFWDGTTWTTQSQALLSSGAKLVTGFNLSLSIGDNIVLAGIAGQRYLIDRLILAVSTATVLQFKDGATLMLGSVPANTTVTLTFPQDPSGEPWFATSAGNAFIINSTAAITLGGRVWYRQA